MLNVHGIVITTSYSTEYLKSNRGFKINYRRAFEKFEFQSQHKITNIYITKHKYATISHIHPLFFSKKLILMLSIYNNRSDLQQKLVTTQQITRLLKNIYLIFLIHDDIRQFSSYTACMTSIFS